MKKAVLYKGSWLLPGSHSRKLYDEGRFKELDQHEKRLIEEAKARGERL